MARTLPTEESLGLSPSEEELTPPVVADEDIGVPEPPAEPAKDEPAEPPVEAAKPEEPKPDEQKLVDVRAVQEARAEAREARRQAAVLEQRWNEFFATQAKPEEPKTELPDATNPLEQIAWLVKEVEAGRISREEATKRANEEGQRQEYARQVERVEGEFKAKTPDYEQALQFAAKSRDEELQLMYPLSTEDQRRDYILKEWASITEQSLQAGLNPAEQAYRFAERRGYQKPVPEAPKPDLTRVAEAQQRHQSLSDAPGGETIAPLDAKALAKMTDKQFKAWMSQKGNEQKFNELMGG